MASPTRDAKFLPLKSRWPDAFNVVDAGRCDACKQLGQFYFFQVSGDEARENSGVVMMQGGYYCEHCGFSNAGAIDKEYWQELKDTPGTTAKE